VVIHTKSYVGPVAQPQSAALARSNSMKGRGFGFKIKAQGL